MKVTLFYIFVTCFQCIYTVSEDRANLNPIYFESFAQNTSPDQLIGQVVGALTKLVNYYDKNNALINFDGMFGAKIVEGQLNLLVAEYKKSFHRDTMDYSMVTELAIISQNAGRAVKKSIVYLHEKSPNYLKQLRRLLLLPWDIGHSHRIIDFSLLWDDQTKHLHGGHDFNEVESDLCMNELLEPVDRLMCSMTNKCLQMMTTAGLTSYRLTHQILYTIVAEMSGCGSRLEKWLVKTKRSSSLEELQGEMCTNLYTEALVLSNITFSSSYNHRDLFMEMQFVCGMLGYSEMVREDWLIKVLNWQTESGCFSAQTMQPNTIGRKLLVEEELPDGCLCHLTATGACALAVHLRYLVDPGPAELAQLRHRPPRPLPLPLSLMPPGPIDPYPVQDEAVVYNSPLYRDDIESGLNRIAEEEKSLEDKIDKVIEDFEVANSIGGKQLQTPMLEENSHGSQVPLPADTNKMKYLKHLQVESEDNQKDNLTSPVVASYLVLASILIVIVFMLIYIQGKRRLHLVYRNSYRL